MWQTWQLTPPSNGLVTPGPYTVQLTTPSRQQPCFEALLQQLQTENWMHVLGLESVVAACDCTQAQ